MEAVDKRRKNAGGGGPNAKSPRRKNKNGINKGIKEEKISPVLGTDPGGVNCGSNLSDPHGDCSSTANQSKPGLPDELLLNGSDIKLENPSTPQLLESKHSDCNSISDIPPLSDLGHSDFPDCKPQMDSYGYPLYNNMPPSNSSLPSYPGDYGPPPPHMMGGYHQPPQPHHAPLQNATKQQPSTLEQQYMQQQNQIFVFSTKLANKAAEAVLQGQFPTIIAFHTSQAATRKFLECQGNPSWSTPPPSGGKMGKGSKTQQHHSSQMSVIPGGVPNSNIPPDFIHQGHPPSSPCNMFNMGSKSSPQQQYSNYYDGPGMMGPHSMGPGVPMGSNSMAPGGPMGYHSMGHGGPLGPHCMGSRPMGPGPSPMGQQPYFGNGPPSDGPPSNRLTGVKIPDENLTPQQRHHREEQLAKLRKLQQVLIPDNEHPGHPGDATCQQHHIQPHENVDGYSMQPARPPSGPLGMDYNMHGSGGPLSNKPSSNNDWSPGPFFMDGPGIKQSVPMGSTGNGPRSVKGGGGSIPSPATPLTPGSSCGAPHRPSPHSPLSSDPLYPGSGGHSFYPSGYYSPQVGQVHDNSPSGGTVQRKDSESSNSDGGKSRKDKSSSSVSPNSSAPPSVKEPNLMPVPSPQQIQYLHTFEGQELTIQKQPNMGLSDNPNDTSPGIPPSHLDMNPSTPNLSQQKPSHSAPPTPVSMNSVNPKSNPDSMTSNTSSSKVRPGSVGPTTTPKSSTTPNPSPGMDRSSQPGTPLQMSMMEMKSSVTFSGGMNIPGNGSQAPCMMKQLPLSMDSHPDVSGGVYDNVPLNPNLSGPPPPGSKPTFDPITSMVQMSQQLGGNGNSPNAPGGGGGGNSGYGMNPGGPSMNPSMVNFNTSMHNVQNIDGGGLGMGGPQTVNNTYVNATMTIQQMNIQNMPPYMNHGGNMGPMSHQMGIGQQMGQMPQMSGVPPGMGMNQGGPMGSMQHGPQMGPNSMGSIGPNSMGPGGPMPHNTMGHIGPIGPHSMGPAGPMGQNAMGQMGPNSMGPGGPMGPNSMAAGGPGGGPMGQQQLGAMGPMCGSRGPPPTQMYGNQPHPQRLSGQGSRGAPYRLPNNPRSFAGTNIQVKPNAPNTIQYLPARPPPSHNQGQMCPQTGVLGPGPVPGPRAPPNLEFLQRYTNPSPGPVVNVNMGINVNVNIPGNRVPIPYPGGPPGPPQGMVSSNVSSPCGGPMRGPNPNPHGLVEQGHMGQQLPPNMMGSARGGMKGPNDPIYAQQFHEFQRTLYATGTNNGRNPDMPPNMPTNPTPPNQQFFK